MQPFCDLVSGKFGVPLTVVDCFWNFNYIAGTTNLGELQKMSDVVTKANNEVKDHGKASIFGKFQAGGSKRVRSDLPARQTSRTRSIGAKFRDDEDVDRYQLYDEMEAKVAVMHRDGERPHRRQQVAAKAAMNTQRGRHLERSVSFKAEVAPRLNEQRLVEETPQPNDMPRMPARFQALRKGNKFIYRLMESDDAW